MFTDSHCHLNYKGLVEDQQAVLARARAAGVSTMLNISTRASEWDDVIASPSASRTSGPRSASTRTRPTPSGRGDRDPGRARGAPAVVGIGESGLDFYYDRSDRDRQRASFRAHIAAARETGLPIIVHTRDAEEDTHAILAEEMGKGAFIPASSTASRRARISPTRRSISASTSPCPGIVTFKNAKDLQATLRTFLRTGC
jgi:TatD DNase family protein